MIVKVLVLVVKMLVDVMNFPIPFEQNNIVHNC